MHGCRIVFILDTWYNQKRGDFLAQRKNIVKMNSGFRWNIGIVIFLIIIVYVAFNVFSYLTSNPISEYEVYQGTIATNHVYHGLILRDETVVSAGQSGYINYYLKEGSKASVNDVICSIDTNGELSKKIKTAATDGSQLDSQTLSDISEQIDSFRNSYDPMIFSSASTIKSELNATLSQNLSENALADLSDALDSASENNTFYREKSETPGVIVYYTDGYESVTASNFTPENMSSTDYSRTELDEQTEVKSTDAAYKRINSEDWDVIIRISDDMAKELKDTSSVSVRFCKDDYKMSASCSILKKDGNYYLDLGFKTAMIRYVNDRFVDVELVIDENTGLKIPVSAITTKEFYTIPKEYFTESTDSSGECLMVQNDDSDDVTLVSPTVYYETDDFYYVDSEDVTAGDVIRKSDSSSKYIIGTDVDELKGVYNINKGYAVFKQINILSQNENYAIVETKTSYGIALYDHIALEADKVQEDQLVR
jgi:hypothetical protein